MPKTIELQLAGKTYAVQPLRMRYARAWRQKLEAPLGQLVQALESVDQLDVDKLTMTDASELVRGLASTLLGSVDLVIELLFDFSPELTADREHIEKEAFDEEALAAFGEVLKLAYPLVGLLAAVRGSGRTAPTQNQTE